jgi:hypothetical protein
MEGYDIIGDIHGCAGMLEALLKQLGYRRDGEVFFHPRRKAVFVGDLIDRGKRNFYTLRIVKGMVNNGAALAVLGNHEYNALCYHTPNDSGGFLRPHSSKNQSQHQEVLDEIQVEGEAEWRIFLDWFKALPLYLDLDGIRVVHACWDPEEITFLKQTLEDGARMTGRFFDMSVRRHTAEFNAVEIILKGKELALPEGLSYRDRDGHTRKRVRVKWWMVPEEFGRARTFADIAQAPREVLSKLSSFPLGDNGGMPVGGYSACSDPVFFGHYWFNGTPHVNAAPAVCLDYSAVRGGYLCSYRYSGESRLSDRNFVYV